MASVLGYINTGSAAASTGVTLPNTAWCRPVHRSACCIFVTGGSSCCMCVPTTATCFVIEMWGQGGGGAGGCCCGVGSYGGQGGSYGWVTCTTSGTNHILCACACICGPCSICSICSGNCGQFSRVCNFGGPGGFWCVCGGVGGCWCCFPNAPWCWSGANQNPSGANAFKYNTFKFFKDCSTCLATPAVAATGSSFTGTELQNCCSGTTQTSIPVDGFLFGGCAACGVAAVGGGGGAGGPIDCMFNLCVCTCFSSPYVWQGACGWSDPANGSSPASCYNIACANANNSPVNANCGGGMGIGGAAYAGGDQAMHGCAFQCGSCWVQCGNFPGGGGMSSWTLSAWANPGWGAPGLILMSWS